MRVLVTGAAGQVGREVVRLGMAGGHEVVGLDRAALDITDAAAVRDAVASHRPDAVVNAAAYTAVDRAEAEAALALAVNRDGARLVAEAAEGVGAALVHLSTDYVFDGTLGRPYRPDDRRAPLNVYGRSKAEGEDAVLSTSGATVVLRTAWVVSGDGTDFVSAMWRLARGDRPLRVVADQWGHPTPAAAVAEAALAAAARARDGLAGVLHVAGAPLATWADLADAALVALHGDDAVPVERIPTSAYPTAAARPRRVELALAPSRAALGLPEISWEAGLQAIVARKRGGEAA